MAIYSTLPVKLITFFCLFSGAENDVQGVRRNYCYYTQFVTPIINACGAIDRRENILSPVIRSLGSTINLKLQLLKMFKGISGSSITFMQVSSAYDSALKKFNEKKNRLVSLYEKHRSKSDINIVLLGRPYTVLSSSMNKGIPEIIGKIGVKAFFRI